MPGGPELGVRARSAERRQLCLSPVPSPGRDNVDTPAVRWLNLRLLTACLGYFCGACALFAVGQPREGLEELLVGDVAAAPVRSPRKNNQRYLEAKLALDWADTGQGVARIVGGDFNTPPQRA